MVKVSIGYQDTTFAIFLGIILIMTGNSKKGILITPEKLGGERVVHPLKLHRSP